MNSSSPDGRSEGDRRRAAPQRALADRQGQRIHDADKRDHARGFAVDAHRLADGAQITPIAADTAPRRPAKRLVPQVDDAVEMSLASFKKQEIGKPRSVPPLDSTGVAGMNHRFEM